MRAVAWCLLLLATTALVGEAEGFFHKASPVTSYDENSELLIFVNSITSREGVMPFSFYRSKICKPSEAFVRKNKNLVEKENIGAILWGNRIELSLYSVNVLSNTQCTVLCKQMLTASEARQLQHLIDQGYRGHFILDSLPALYASDELDALNRAIQDTRVVKGFPLGLRRKDVKEYVLFNHVQFTVLYNRGSDGKVIIVGFFVTPSSIKHVDNKCSGPSDTTSRQLQNLGTAGGEVTYSYGVTWTQVSGANYLDRLTIYMRSGVKVKRDHWLTVVNSLLLLSFATLIVALILIRTVRKDLLAYTDVEEMAEAQEETGWKLLRGDVFRAPENPLVLSALIGTGCQVLLMMALTLVAVCASRSLRSTRGAILTMIIFFFLFTSGLSGYIAARMLKYFKKQSWKNGFYAVSMVPGSFMALYMTLNLIQWSKHASSAIPFSSLFTLCLMWCFFSMPLAMCGLAIGFRQDVISVPAEVASIPRLIPQDRLLFDRLVLIVGGGLVPFSAAFIEVVYMLSAFWQGQPYHLFGFLAAIGCIVLVTCAEVSVVLTYILLCAEDYRWWWYSFHVVASSGLLFFLYSVFYLIFNLTIRNILSVMLYIGYSFAAACLVSLMTGTVGFLSAAWFVRSIFKAIKAD